MRIALAVHAWPPEGSGGTERSTRALARALARAGHDVLVVAGSLRRAAGAAVELERAPERDPVSGASLRVARVHRPDLYFDHWHKSLHPGVAEALRGLLREHCAEVLHVHHWLRLSRDLVRAAALEGVPSVVTLHDAWTSCPVAFRVRPDDRSTCGVPAGPHPCVACAGAVPPRTPWVPTDEAWMAFARRQQDLARELELARAVCAPTAAHAAAIEGQLGLGPGALGACVVPPARERIASARLPAPASPHEQGRLRLVSWAGLAPHKGADLLIEALGREPLRGRVALDLVGDTVDPGFSHRLRNAATGLQVRLPGHREPEALAELARGAHAFVTATRARESYGVALDEALELGLPVVAPRTPAFSERAASLGALLLYEQGDAASLAQVLASLLDEPGLWARLAGAAHEVELPGPEEVAARTLELYEQAAGAGAPPTPAPEWFEARMALAALRAWDESLARRSAAELGLEA
jgi:glycosyltransferase involved in cell wall biosynthesis